ncbi:MAG TPA: methylisocitrate lyase [Hyphomicrobiaceae bacterium]|nr:methylisocitrate lyase [Hyphomicrobiaceae bacterium]
MGRTWLEGAGDGRHSHGRQLRELIASRKALAVPGAHDGMSALLARRAGFEALYLSGAALSASMALPDLGLITLEDVSRRAREIVRAASLPLIVDCDTGFGEALNVMHAVRALEEIGAACVQIEDQQFPKKCGHLNDKRLISVDDMCRKVAAAKKAAVDILLCARTDAAAASLDDAIVRANRYAAAGADLIFVEALASREDIKRVREEVRAPLLANMTEFGRTPELGLSEWQALGYEVVIYPVSAFRIASRAMADFYGLLRKEGQVGEMIEEMMTRAELYNVLGYYDYEALDSAIARTVLPGSRDET